MDSFDTKLTKTLKTSFSLNSNQLNELHQLITPPKAWENIVLRNRRNKPLRMVMCHNDDAKATVILAQGRAQVAEEWSEFAHNMSDNKYNFITYDPQGQGQSYRHNDDNTRHHIDTWQTEIDDLEDVINYTNSFSYLASMPKILIGHSRGSYSALRLFSQKPEIKNQFVCAAHIAPMINVKTSKALEIAAPIIINLAKLFNKMNSYAPTQGPLTLDRYLNHMHKITSDPIRRAVQWSLFNENSEITCGGPTIGFVNEAFKCTKYLLSTDIPESIETPTLFALGGREQILNNDAAICFSNRMPNAKTIIYSAAEHQVHMEVKLIRDAFYNDLNSFIQKHLPS